MARSALDLELLFSLFFSALVVRCLTRRFLPEYAPCREAYYKYKKRDQKDGKELEMLIVDSDGQVKSFF